MVLRGRPWLSTCVGGTGREVGTHACTQGMPGLPGGQDERKARQDGVEQRAPVLRGEVELGFHLIGNVEPSERFSRRDVKMVNCLGSSGRTELPDPALSHSP